MHPAACWVKPHLSVVFEGLCFPVDLPMLHLWINNLFYKIIHACKAFDEISEFYHFRYYF